MKNLLINVSGHILGTLLGFLLVYLLVLLGNYLFHDSMKALGFAFVILVLILIVWGTISLHQANREIKKLRERRKLEN